MIVYRCDFCGETRDCGQHEIENREYDVCAECWTALMAKLHGKGRPRKGREMVMLPLPPQPPAPAPETKPHFPERPTIIADGGVH